METGYDYLLIRGN